MVPPRATLRFDTYFNVFFEQHWRQHTKLRDLRLAGQVDSPCDLRVFRRSSAGVSLLHEQFLPGGGPFEVAIPAEPFNFRQHGLLWFEITAGDQPVTFLEANWVAAGELAASVGLGVVFCTFNREGDIGKVLDALTADPQVADRIARIFVVNQGRPGLACHPAVAPALARTPAKVRIIEQGNFGGAGGFSRGLLEALDDDAVTHVAFLDDDIQIEPDSLLRMASFFALSNDDAVVGGHMLDSVQPTKLYEAGAVIDSRNWSFNPQHHMLDIADPQNLGQLLGPSPIHYNGWWCFGFSKAIVARMGMPLPCFIRGDDTEFGLRLYSAGLPTLPMPGIAVWHEPFYLKLGGWQLYYETRNMLIAASCHFGFEPLGVAVRMLKHLLLHLLTFRYYSAALIVRGIEDFLRGPRILDGPPQPLHASLNALRTRYPPSVTGRAQVLAAATIPDLPKGRLGYCVALARALIRNGTVPTRTIPPRRLDVHAFSWVVLKRADHIALDTWWDTELPTFQRSREHFRDIGWRGLVAIFALYRRAAQMKAEWRAAHSRLTSQKFWRDYLGLNKADPVQRAGKPPAGPANILQSPAIHPQVPLSA